MESLDLNDVTTDVYMPVLDDPIDTVEVSEVIEKNLKSNKGCGPDGVAPGIFKLLPAQWLLYITMLLNAVFHTHYPESWRMSKLVVLFKKGLHSQCDNYRGLSLMNSLAKIYDYVLTNRLANWFKPDREQAGAQPKRSCTEHILALRLIMDYCFHKKKKLFILFWTIPRHTIRCHGELYFML